MTDLYPQSSRALSDLRKQLAPDIHDAFEALSKKVFADGALPAKTKQLIAVAVAHVTQCPYCINGHTKAALRAGRSVAIYSLPRLLNEIRDTHRAERSHVDLLDRLTAVDLLHVDDLGAEQTTEWVLEALYSIVNARYEDERSIVLTTNCMDRDELCGQITPRTVSRLTEMCDELPLLGHDHRMDLRTV